MSRHQSSDLLQGTLDMLILKVAALEPIHGYAIVQRLQQISKEALQIRQGSLYPALYRLERRGWLKADWKTTEGGRQAKFYKLSRARGVANSNPKPPAGSACATLFRWFWRQTNENSRQPPQLG